MASSSFSAPVGTRDVMPPESAQWVELVARFAQHVANAGFGLVQSPMFEDLGVFLRVGEGTDIVTKEMYDFIDKGGRHLALRPEGTASIVRAYLQHRPQRNPWKAWYVAPNFRYERPQAGRYRQHHQLGVEVLGSPDADLDVEVITLQADFYAQLGLRQVRLLLNSMGTPEDRSNYTTLLGTWLQDHSDQLHPQDLETARTNPMRVLDSKRAETVAALSEAPSVLESLSEYALEHFERVQQGLRAAEVDFDIEPRLVRGLDYYTHSTFEFQALALEGAQNAIGGGGRYDGLASALGGPETPGVGFGSGIERILLALQAEEALQPAEQVPLAFVVDTTGGTHARDLVTQARRAGLFLDRAYDRRSMKSQMKAADRSGAALALIIGEEEAAADNVTVRDLRGPASQMSLERSDLIEYLRKQP